MKTPPHILAALLGATMALPPGNLRARGKQKPKVVDKAKRRAAKASRKRNRG